MDWSDPRKGPFVPLAHRGELPHLYKPNSLYFVTFRLADAITPIEDRQPRSRSIDSLGDFDPESMLDSYDPPLTLGSCALGRADIAKLVQDALLFFDGTRYLLGAWCVMPNHVHVIVFPLGEYGPAQILQSWKGFTAREANRILGKKGAFWERESYDHLVRNLRSLERLSNYVEMNPVAAGLCVEPEDWTYGSAGAGHKSTFWRR